MERVHKKKHVEYEKLKDTFEEIQIDEDHRAIMERSIINALDFSFGTGKKSYIK